MQPLRMTMFALLYSVLYFFWSTYQQGSFIDFFNERIRIQLFNWIIHLIYIGKTNVFGTTFAFILNVFLLWKFCKLCLIFGVLNTLNSRDVINFLQKYNQIPRYCRNWLVEFQKKDFRSYHLFFHLTFLLPLIWNHCTSYASCWKIHNN